MKYLILILLSLSLLSSCKEKPQTQNNLEISTSIDTTQAYFVVEKSKKVYLIEQNKTEEYCFNQIKIGLANIIVFSFGIFVGLLINYIE